MNMNKTLLSVIAVLFFSSSAYSLDVPMGSRHDGRVQQLNYNPYNVTLIKAKTGYVTAINFGEDESVVDIAVGFSDGWEVKDSENRVYLRPVSFSGEGNETAVEPVSEYWNTNLVVATNKKIYNFDLILEDDVKKQSAYLVRFNYPADAAKKADAERKKQQSQREAEALNTELDRFTTPKNWNYAMKVGKDSAVITPDFAYDDGVRTYLGFSPEKTIPSVFYYQGNTEMMSNINQKEQGKYTVIVVHKVAERMILRSGDQVVGIINHSFGKVSSDGRNTSSGDVIRVTK